MATRIKDIAKALDLSISTVQSVLRNVPGFKEATRRRILAKAKELNYRPNQAALSLVTQKSHALGVVVPNLSRSFFPDVLEGIDQIAYASGYDLMVVKTDDDIAREDKGISTLISRQVDGLIVASARKPGENNGAWKSMSYSGTPLVLVDRFFPVAPFVGADDERIGFLATQHLLRQGYRAIAHLGRQSVATGIGRYRGYVRALRESGFRVRRDHILTEVAGEAGGYEGTKQLLKLRPLPDAIFAASDPVAIGAMRAVRESGLRIPEDIGVIGVGNVRYGEELRVPLSTVDQHRIKMGKTAASILLGMIAGKSAPRKPVFIEPTLVVRASSCRTSETPRSDPR